MKKFISILSFSYAGIYTICISIYAWVNYRSFDREEYRRLAHVLFLSGFTETVTITVAHCGYPTLPGQHLYVMVNCIVVSRFYAYLFKEFVKPRVIYTIAGIFCVLSILNTIFLQSLMTYDSNALTLSGIIFSTYSLFTFIILFRGIVKETEPELIRSLTWINSGFFLFYFYSLLIFYFSRYWNQSFSISTLVFNLIFKAINILSYSCLFVGLWLRPRKISLK